MDYQIVDFNENGNIFLLLKEDQLLFFMISFLPGR